MSHFLLGLMPGMMAKYEYARDLLKWARSTLDAVTGHHAKSTIGYPTLDPILLSSLEKVAHDLGSVPLLQYVIKLRALNERLERTNAKQPAVRCIAWLDFLSLRRRHGVGHGKAKPSDTTGPKGPLPKGAKGRLI